MKKYTRTIQYSLLQSCFWMAFAGVITFNSVYMLGCDFTNAQIGLIMALCGIASAIAQTTIAGFIDKSKGTKLKPAAILLTVILLGLSAASGLIGTKGPIVSGLLFSLEIAFIQMLLPLVNSLAVGKESEEGKTNFGIARGIGSLAYAAATALMGYGVKLWGVVFIPAFMTLIFGILLLCYNFYSYRSDVKEETVVASSGNFLARYPRFALVLVGALLVYISHSIINTYSYQTVVSKGWDSVVMGNAGSIAAISELPMMFGFAWLCTRRKVSFWLRICGIAFFLKTLFTLLAGSVAVFNGIQLFQMFGWAIISVASVQYVHKLLPPEDAVKGQSYFTMSYTAATVLSGLLGGVLIDNFGMQLVLILATIAAGIGAVILLLAVEKVE